MCFNWREPLWMVAAAVLAIVPLPVTVRAAASDELDPQWHDGDPVQGLDAFMERHGHKPYDLFREGDALRTHRLIFEDRRFGTLIWMIDDSPTADHGATASVWPAWNADASRLSLPGERPGADGTTQRFIVDDHYTRLVPAPALTARGARIIWDRHDPDIYFVHNSGELVEVNVRSGTVRTVAQWEPHPRERVYGLTADNRYVFLDTPNGGIWVSYDPADAPIPQLGQHDGRPAAPREAGDGGGAPIPQLGQHGGRPSAPRADGQPAHPQDPSDVLMVSRHVAADHEHWGHIMRIRIGLRIDRKTGAIEHIIAPIAGHDEYLRTFMSDRVQWPQGPRWEKYRFHRSDDLEAMFAIYRYYPFTTHGHESPSPDGLHFAKDGTWTRITHVRHGHGQSLKLSADGGNYHLHWVKHSRFFIAWVRGWRYGTFDRPQHANVLFQVFSDLTAQPVFDTRNRMNTVYAGGDFSMLSPDATKVHTGSAMTGQFRNYVAVLARPRPPQALTWRTDGRAIVLDWKPSDFSRETRGYHIYRSDRSGDGYKLLNREPVPAGGTAWRDTSITPGRHYYYVVTAVEHSGLESGYSPEAARAGVKLLDDLATPLVVYAEAEAALWDLPADARPGLAVGRDVRGASDWYYIYRHPEAETGEAELTIHVPAAGDYHLWARVRRGEDEVASWRQADVDTRPGTGRWQLTLGGQQLQVATSAGRWTWQRVDEGAITLAAGRNVVTLRTRDHGAELDMIALAMDGAFEPAGPRPEMRMPPPAVTELVARNIEPRVNELRWRASEHPTFSHYHVYASRQSLRGESLSQRHRIASPTEPIFIDWGLRADEQYHYAVTAVDRRGNESEPVFADASTAPRPKPKVKIELAFAEAELEGDFERVEATGLRGPAYIVPIEPQRSRVTWRIDVPHDGDYYIWLRCLERGHGGRTGGVRQELHASLNGEALTVIGNRATDLNVADAVLHEHPYARDLWTWLRPGRVNHEAVHLPAGEHVLTVEHLARVRYDVLLITDEPSYRPSDGRMGLNP